MSIVENNVLLEDKIKIFLSEDFEFEDITTNSVVDEESTAKAIIICKEDGIIAGLEEASAVFNLLGCRTEPKVRDGTAVKLGTHILGIKGSTRSILKGERTALNILTRMSGIATATWKAQSEAKIANSKVRVAATRKTAPGLRYFDKKAVKLGGGDTHRFRLDDCVLIKNNHLIIVGSITEAVKRARERVSFTKKIEVEVETLKQAIEAAESGADIIMLDNMGPEDICKAIRELENKGLRAGVLIEASGGVTERNIKQYASTGVDIISLGSLTHSSKAIDMSLKIMDD